MGTFDHVVFLSALRMLAELRQKLPPAIRIECVYRSGSLASAVATRPEQIFPRRYPRSCDEPRRTDAGTGRPRRILPRGRAPQFRS